MKVPKLKIGKFIADLPIVQGGMAVKISTAKLAAAVAKEGGIGVIAGTGLEPEELRLEIQKARSLTDGILGVNVLYAVKNFAALVKTAFAEKIDLLISGAGFSREMFIWGKETGTAIVPVVSSAKLASLAERLGAAAVVVEGKEAGGHLGTDRKMMDILPEVLKSVSIPVLGAGGIINGFDIAKVLKAGAQGVQMGTRFAASLESNASLTMKKRYVEATAEDVVVIPSPVGFPGRAVRNPFTDKISQGAIEIKKCHSCLKECSHRYCIMEALLEACQGEEESNSLYFAGEGVTRIKEVLSVKEIFQQLLTELALA